MHFGLTEERQLLQHTLRDFTAKELPATRLREIFDGGGWDADLWRAASVVGIQGLALPEHYGGAGLEFLDLALAFEVLGESAMPGPFLSHALAAQAIAIGGSEDQRERWLPRLISGECVASIAIAEHGGTWSPEAWKLCHSNATLNGSKTFVEHPRHASILVVGIEGGGLALVETDARNLEYEDVDTLDRTRSLDHVTFHDTPAELLPKGPEAASALMDAARILIAADAFGAAWKLISLTVEYALTRRQFGQPIAQFQAVKHQIANLVADVEPMRGLVWYAGHAFDHLPEERAREASIAKAHVTERALQIGRSAVELHGGIGFTWDCDVQFWVKRTMFDRTWLGGVRREPERIAKLGGW